MAISFRRYIDITSGVGAGVRIPGRELIGRIFTANRQAPADAVVEFDEAKEVAAFFGSASEEYKRAAFYFGFISKTQVRARKLGFARYVPQAAPPTLRAVLRAPELEAFQTVADGALVMIMGGQTKIITGLDFTEAGSYAAVAYIVQTGVAAADQDGLWEYAAVDYDAETGTFRLTGGVAGEADIAPVGTPDSGTDIGALLGWDAGAGALVSPGHDAVSITDTLNASADMSNNFGSFLLMGNPTPAMTEQAAEFAHLSNAGFMYCQRVSDANAAAVRELLRQYDGTALTEHDPARPGEYPEMAPMILLASTDYTRRNGTKNYMFQQLNLTPTVQDNAKANAMDALRINYYGRTQQAGQIIDFYQRGVLQGDFQDMNIYANEMWLKDRAGADIMTLKLALEKISANDAGRILVLGCLTQGVIALALNNGAISVNKALDYTQKAFITQVTGDENAWVQVQSQGWWLDVQVEQYTVDDRVEYKIKYLLIYAKDDVIRKTEGTHSLI
jgi:hypothetical protein